MFYNDLDADGITLSPAITNFIDKRIDYISYKYEVVLKFYCDQMSEDEKAKISDMLKAYYGLESNERNLDLIINNYKSITLFFIGIFFLGMASLFANAGFLIKEIFSIAGWVAIWETFTSVLFDTIKIKLDRYDATKLSNAQIEFITKKTE